MIESQVASLTAELRSSGTSSRQDRITIGDWKVTAHSANQVSAQTVVNIAANHSVIAETNRAEFRGTAAQVRAVAQELQASKISVVMDYEGNGVTDLWVCRAISGNTYPMSALVTIATTHSVAASTSSAVFR